MQIIFGLKGFVEKYVIIKFTYFGHITFFILILIEHFESRIIRCFGVQQTPTLQEFRTTRTDSRNSWCLMLGTFGIFAVFVVIEH